MVLLCCLSTVSASENATDDVVAVYDDAPMEEVASGVDSTYESIAVKNDDDSTPILAEGELKDPGLNLTLVRNGAIVTFNEENVNGTVIYSGDSHFMKGESFYYDGNPYLIDLNGFDEDDYPVFVHYLGNNEFTGADGTVMIPVERNDPQLNATLNGTQITVTLSKNVTSATVVAGVSGNNYERNYNYVWDGASGNPIIVDLSDLTPGKYTVDVSSLPNGYYSGSDVKSLEVTVPEKQLKDPGLNLTLVRNGVIVSFDENVTGFFIYYGDVKPNEYQYYDGQPYLIDMNGLPADYYPVNVEYIANENYTGANASVEVQVEPNDPEINATLNGTEITVTFNDKNVSMLDVVAEVQFPNGDEHSFDYLYWNEPLTIDLGFLRPGKYQVDVFSLADDIYYSGSETISFNVTVPEKEQKDPGLNLTLVRNGVLVSFDENVTGFFIYYGDVKPNEYQYYDGQPYLIDMNGLPADYYPVNVEFIANENYTGANASVEVRVEPNDPEINATLNGTVITVTFNDKNVSMLEVVAEVQFPNGDEHSFDYLYWNEPLTIDLAFLRPGEYQVEVGSLPDDIYYSGSQIISFNVTVPEKEQKDPGMNLTLVRNGVLVSFDENVTGFFIYYGDVKPNEYQYYDGQPYLIDMNGLPADYYPVNVEFIANENYTGANASVEVQVEPNDPEINATLNGTEITVTFNDKNVSMLDVVAEVHFPNGDEHSFDYLYWNEPLSIDLGFLRPGKYQVDVFSLADDIYYSGSETISFQVTVPEKELKDPGLNLTVVRNGVVVSFDENVTGFFIYYGDVKPNEYQYYDGQPYLIDMNGLPADYYPVNVEFIANENYTGANSSVEVRVEPNDPEINATLNGTEITVTFNDKNVSMLDVVAEVHFPNGDERSLDYLYWNEPLTIDLGFLRPGEYQVDVCSLPDDIYYSGSETISFKVTVPEEPVVVQKSSEFSDITISDNLTIYITVKDSDGNAIANAPIIYSVNGNQSNTTADANGKFTIAGEPGAIITIGYDGNDNITGTNTTLTLNNPVVPPAKLETRFNITGGVITINGYAVDTKAGEEGIYYATELLDANGNPIKGAKIQFAVNDKIYNRTTKKNGSFTPYKLNMVRAGRYTMAFYFAGNDNYTGTFASVCVDLDKKPIKIKAINKSYKASQKTKKYTVTLSTKVCSSHDGKAHLRSGLKVNLTVNGKTYQGKTNSKGKITFKINNLKNKAKYKAKVSYEGDQTYESASKLVTLTLK